jgi:thiamine biosynthesis lipoprotein
MENEKESEDFEKFPTSVEKNFKSLGTDISIQIIVANDDEKKRANTDLEFLPKIYEGYMQIFSRFEKESELSRLNLNLEILQTASLDMREVVKYSLDYWKKTNGIYDPRIIEILEENGYDKDFSLGNFKKDEINFTRSEFGDLQKDLFLKEELVFFGKRMDFSGIAKGFITDKVSDYLTKCGWKNFLVDSGGDMYFSGVDKTEKNWNVGIEGIADNQLTFSLNNFGIATSGISRRKWEIGEKKYHHLINPKNPEEFSFDLKSVTVIASSTREADIWAKVLFLLGRDDGAKLAKENELAAFFLAYRGGSYISPFGKKFVYRNK